jgi:hypothetical protein
MEFPEDAHMEAPRGPSFLLESFDLISHHYYSITKARKEGFICER